MTSPTEILYWEVLPSIRKQLVIELLELNLKQSQIAKLLNITPSAISQYVKSKRGSEINFDSNFKKCVKIAAKKIKENKSTPFEQTNLLIKEFEKSKNLCEICSIKNNLKGCNICN